METFINKGFNFDICVVLCFPCWKSTCCWKHWLCKNENCYLVSSQHSFSDFFKPDDGRLKPHWRTPLPACLTALTAQNTPLNTKYNTRSLRKKREYQMFNLWLSSVVYTTKPQRKERGKCFRRAIRHLSLRTPRTVPEGTIRSTLLIVERTYPGYCTSREKPHSAQVY